MLVLKDVKKREYGFQTLGAPFLELLEESKGYMSAMLFSTGIRVVFSSIHDDLLVQIVPDASHRGNFSTLPCGRSWAKMLIVSIGNHLHLQHPLLLHAFPFVLCL